MYIYILITREGQLALPVPRGSSLSERQYLYFLEKEDSLSMLRKDLESSQIRG